MKTKIQENYITSIAIFISLILLIFWFFHNPVKQFSPNISGMDNRPDSTEEIIEIVKIGEKFVQFAASQSLLNGKWSRFRGAELDNIVKDKTKLIDNFGNTPPKILWTVQLGEGHAAPAIFNGKVYLLDYIEDSKADALRCFSLETGEELWQRVYNVHVKRNHGMSRTIPAVTDSFIVTIGPKGHVMCSGTTNGNLFWGIDLVQQFNTEIPFWYTGQCPLIDNDTAIIAPAGSALLIGVDCATGKIAWQTPNPDNWKMSHSSIMIMNFKGKKMYVYAAVGGICGISAEGTDKGQILWKTSVFSPNVVAPSPLILDNGKFFMTAGYGAGSVLMQLKLNNGVYSVEVLQHFKPKDGIASEQQTPLLYNNYVFCILPKDAGSVRNQFVCCKDDDFQNIIWTSGSEFRFGLGPYIIADNKFFILNDDGTLTIAKLSTNGFSVLDQQKIIDGVDAWAPLAIADGKLLMRDSKTLVCVDIQKYN